MSAAYEVGLGQHVDRAIDEMIAIANAEGCEIVADFNGTPLVAAPGSTHEAVYGRWDDECTRKGEAYQASPAGREAAAARKRQVAERQRECDILVGTLLDLNFADLAEVLGWLMAFQTVADDVDVAKPTDDILYVFAKNGYLPGVNCGDQFVAEDRENVARWIIGQALDGIRSVGCPHQILHKFAAEWLSA